jgi:hypothetical protein
MNHRFFVVQNWQKSAVYLSVVGSADRFEPPTRSDRFRPKAAISSPLILTQSRHYVRRRPIFPVRGAEITEAQPADFS